MPLAFTAKRGRAFAFALDCLMLFMIGQSCQLELFIYTATCHDAITRATRERQLSR